MCTVLPERLCTVLCILLPASHVCHPHRRTCKILGMLLECILSPGCSTYDTSVFITTVVYGHSYRHTSVAFSSGDAFDEMRSFSIAPSLTPSMDPSFVNRVVDSKFYATGEMALRGAQSIVPRAFRVVFPSYRPFDPIHRAHPYHQGSDVRS